LFILINVVII